MRLMAWRRRQTKGDERDDMRNDDCIRAEMQRAAPESAMIVATIRYIVVSGQAVFDNSRESRKR